MYFIDQWLIAVLFLALSAHNCNNNINNYIDNNKQQQQWQQTTIAKKTFTESITHPPCPPPKICIEKPICRHANRKQHINTKTLYYTHTHNTSPPPQIDNIHISLFGPSNSPLFIPSVAFLAKKNPKPSHRASNRVEYPNQKSTPLIRNTKRTHSHAKRTLPHREWKCFDSMKCW